jgi:cytoskeletal protein RodZ
MVAFKQKKIESIESLGEKLKRHRQRLGFSVEKAARQININHRYIKILENDDYKKMPAAVYTKNFLKRYATWLKLNPAMVLALHEKERQLFFQTIEKKQKPKTPTSLIKSTVDLILKPHTLKFAALILVSSLVLVYLGISINKIFAPPELIIKTPHESSIITTERSINLAGITEKEVELTINAKPILSDNDGKFSLLVDLQKGLNIIKITAKKKHSKPKTVYRQVMVADSEDENQLTETIIDSERREEDS